MEVRAREEVDRLLREANVLRMRGQHQQAEAKCRAALSASPDDAGALEFLGDLLRERDQMDEALEQYRRALEQAPGRPSVEKKFAEVTLELAERQRLRELAHLALTQPELFREKRRKRSVSVALVSALLWPGLGQFYNAEGLNLKGGILAVLALLCLPGLLSLFQLMLVLMGFGRAPGADGWAALGLLFLFLWIYGIGDAVVEAQKSSGAPTDRLGL